MASIQLVEGKLKLKINEEKSATARPWEHKLKTKRRNLVALGFPLEWAANISGSRKGY